VISLVIYLVISGRDPGIFRIYLVSVAAGFDRELGADQRPEAGTQRRFVEARSAVDAVLIEQRQRRIAERGRPLDERFGQ
jgi:hypothetical protein